MEREGLVAPEPPIVAVNEHSGNPHYAPMKSASSPIRRGDFILFDFWARLREPTNVDLRRFYLGGLRWHP